MLLFFLLVLFMTDVLQILFSAALGGRALKSNPNKTVYGVLGGSAWYVFIQKKHQKGTRVSWDMDFAVRNTDEIGKVFTSMGNDSAAICCI